LNYSSYKYIYPPRPEKKISPESLVNFENGYYLAQPKLNGSSMQVYTDGKQLVVTNRHKQILSHKMNTEELKKLHRGNGWIVLCGEYMNKNQRDEEDNYWNHKFVIFDILVYEGVHLLKTTFNERYELLRKLYPDNPVKKQLHKISENCLRVNSVHFGLTNIFKDITRHQMYEGLVMKLGHGKLENGTTQNNNTKTQIKCRKATKNYPF
jgi:hypothetical protein